MKIVKDFAGFDGFYWWFGIVENRQDPEKLGRCRVRIYGLHNGNLSDIPTEDLPWAHPVHSLNNHMFSTPKEGDLVFGFFIDGHHAQQPVIMGIVPIKPSELPDGETGFNDVRTEEELQLAPKKPRGLSYGNNLGTGVKVMEQLDGFELARTHYDNQNYPTNSDLARNERIKNTFIQNRRDSLVGVKGAFGTSWKEPFPAYDAKYPYNRVMETESGHIQEFDDTPGAERIHTAHRAGTFEEIYPSGTKVEKIVKNNYRIVLADDHLYVAGKVNITVNSHANIRVEGDINLEGRGDLTVGIAGDVNFTVGGDFKLKAKTVAMETLFDYNIKSAGALKLGTDRGLHLSTQKLKLSSDNGLTILTNGELLLSGGGITLESAKEISMIAPATIGLATAKFDVAAPVSNFGVMLNAMMTNLKAIGPDSHGDGHCLTVGFGSSAPIPPVVVPRADQWITPGPKPSLLGSAPTYGDPTLSPRYKEVTPDNKTAFGMGGTTEDEKSIDAFIKAQIDNGLYTKEQIDEGILIAKKPTETDPNFKENNSTLLPVSNSCDINETTEIDGATELSKYYMINDFTMKPIYGKFPLKPQRGLSKAAIACNMKCLAVNCLDKIREQYPTMKIVNGFRYTDEFSSGQSQHEIGQAVDLQFDSLTNNPTGYYEVALWIKDNIPYDQLLLEFRTTGARSPWIHISYNPQGNRGATVQNKVATTMNHKIVASKLVKLDTTVKTITPVAASKSTSNGLAVIPKGPSFKGFVRFSSLLPEFPTPKTGDSYIVSSTIHLWTWNGTVWNDMGLAIKGTVEFASQLPSAIDSSAGDSYVVSSTDHLWTWTGTNWVDKGKVQDITGTYVVTETMPSYDSTGKLTNIQIVTTLDPKTGNITKETTTNDGEVEVITTKVTSSDGSQIGETKVSVNKFNSDDPRDGPGGDIAKLLAGYSFIMNFQGGILAKLLHDAVTPYLRQMDSYANQAGNIADQAEVLMTDIKDIGCKIYGQYSTFVGKVKREMTTAKDAVKTAESQTEKGLNTKFSTGGLIHAAVKVGMKALDDKIQDELYKLLSMWDALICKLKMFWPNELKALQEEIHDTYDRIQGAYDRVIAKRVKKYKQLRDDIRNHKKTWCDEVKAESDKDRTRKGCKE